MSTREAAEKWRISDRRVRVLCREGRIDGVIEENGSYLIPLHALKPTDRRYRKPVNYEYEAADTGISFVSDGLSRYIASRTILYLKWSDEVVAHIDDEYNVYFTRPDYNEVVKTYTAGGSRWDRSQFEDFLRDRIVSRDRRDIEKILFRCGLSDFDVIKVGIATKAVNARDLLWITDNADEKMQDAVTSVFDSVFLQKIDAEGDSVDTPDGYNIKRYGVYDGNYGIYKKRLSPVVSDAESELAVYGIAKLLGVPCCRVERVDEDTIFSVFEYDFAHEYIVHMRRLFDDAGAENARRSENEFNNLISVRPEYQADFVRMIALDFVTRQDDRHLSNIAIKVSEKGESFYPLYDNGRSLFYEDSEETASKACADIVNFSTSFGPTGTYYDYVKQISDSGISFNKLLNLEIDSKEVRKILENAGIKGYRYDASLEWIEKTLQILRDLG